MGGAVGPTGFAPSSTYADDDELELTRVTPRPSSVTTIHLPLDVSDDREFWDVWGSGPQFGTPLYYLPHLERFPDRSAAVISAIARAPAGAVAFPLWWRTGPMQGTNSDVVTLLS